MVVNVMKIGVVHLIRRRNGLAPFQRFLESYKAHPAGQEHDLVLIFKGFSSEKQTRPYDSLLTAIPHRRMYISDRGYDLGAYIKAVENFDYDYFFFLNSFSRIQFDNWLVNFYRGLTIQGVGLSGATGSFESISANFRRRDEMLSKLSFAGRLRFLFNYVADAPTRTQGFLRLSAWGLRALGLWDIARLFPDFPNSHIRTNAFMASRQVLTRLRIGPLWLKFSTYLLESGYESITKQVAAAGLRAVVVAGTGQVYEREEWPNSATFRQQDQENLMVADNQTDFYATADLGYRTELSRRAWGDQASLG